MNVYAESSAVLAWLFRQGNGLRVEAVLRTADNIISSDLTLIECDRAMHRQVSIGHLAASTARQLSADLATEVAHWFVLEFTPSIVARARQPFPDEPIRSLDALHMAWALHAKAQRSDLAILTLDDRIRRVGQSLGFELRP